jgi:hypothetical protein
LPDLIVFFACTPFAFEAQQPAFVPVALAFDMSQSLGFFTPFADAISPELFTGMIVASFEFFAAEVNDAFVPCMQHEAFIASVHFTAQSFLL